MTDAPHVLTWEELCADPSLQDLPYRIELNALNQIVMSPLYFRHGYHQAQIAKLLGQLLPSGEASVESAVMTADNVKVPDVVWAPREFIREHFEAFALPVAPPICVEVLSPTNRVAEIDGKRTLYFESGAREVWICGLQGEMEFYSSEGRLERSGLCPERGRSSFEPVGSLPSKAADGGKFGWAGCGLFASRKGRKAAKGRPTKRELGNEEEKVDLPGFL